MSFDPKSLGELYPWTPKQLELGDHTLSYLDEGPRDAEETILCVHGNPTWSFYYRGIAKAFSDRYRVVIPDHIGAGLSDKPQDYDYTLKTHIDNLTRLVEHLELKNVNLVVHDWGGPIGLGWALLRDNMERVLRVTILNTSAFLSARIPFSINICRIPGFGSLCIRGMNAFGRAAVVRAATSKLSKTVKHGYLGPYDSWANRVGHLRFVHDIPMHAGIPSYEVVKELEAAVPTLREFPVLICWGIKDFCFNESFLDGFTSRLPEAEVHRFEKAGHYVLEDAGEQVIAQIAELLKKPGGRAAAGATSGEAATPAASSNA